MHAGAVPPDEERCVVLDRLFHKFHRRGGDLHINGLHALLGQRASILDLTVCVAVNNTTGPKLLGERLPVSTEYQVGRVVGALRLLLRIQVVEVAKKLVEAVISRQHIIAVTELVLAELTGRIALRQR